MSKAIFAAPILSENAARVIGHVGEPRGWGGTQDLVEKLPEPLHGVVAQLCAGADVVDVERLAVEAVAEKLGSRPRVRCL
jgi:hypothetical protein